MGSGLVRGARAGAGARHAPPYGASSPTGTPTEGSPRLRLAVTRGVLGLELDEPYALGPLRVTELAIAFPQARFPVDLSGGVARFRHKRGELRHLALDIDPVALAAWVAPKLRGLLTESAPEVRLIPFASGMSVGLHDRDHTLAFDIVATPLNGDLRLFPERARGLGLGAPPHAVALRAIAAAVATHGRVMGGAVHLHDLVANIARRLLPVAGARVPSADLARWAAVAITATSSAATHLVLDASASGSPPALGARELSAIELADLAGDADDASARGDLEAARASYLRALERAPRHPEIARRLAWIDAATGRHDAALASLVDVVPAVSAGVLGGILLEAIGDADGAAVAFTRAAHGETHGPSAGFAWASAARLATSPHDRLEALDQAVARAPSLETPRWDRLDARLDVADMRGARADAEHLEAASQGAEAKLAVARRAAAAFLERGHVEEAGALFERALRYAPDDVTAIVGLARSLREGGMGGRAVDLYARAVALATRNGGRDLDAELELARALCEVAGDRPAAIARARSIPAGAEPSAEARFLEGRWRSEIGDAAGAAIAFGRFRDAVELMPPVGHRATATAALLVEAAELEENDRGDLAAATRDLGLALRLAPHDRSIASRFRATAARAARPEAPSPPTPRAPLVPAIELAPPEPEPVDETSDDDVTTDEASDEQLVETLTAQLRGNPRDHRTAMALARTLDRLGHDMDLLALLSARLDEGDADERAEVMPMRRAVLERLAETARAEGRASEAELYEMMAASD